MNVSDLRPFSMFTTRMVPFVSLSASSRTVYSPTTDGSITTRMFPVSCGRTRNSCCASATAML